MSNWRFFLLGYISFSTTAPKWSHTNCIVVSYSRSTWMTSQDQEISLQDIRMAVKIQGDNNTKVRQEISNLRQTFHGASLSVSSQVKQLKTDSQYTSKYEGNKVQYLLNSKF
jgi:hypothetical protein